MSAQSEANKKLDGFSKDERAAMKERARELKAANTKAEDLAVLLEKLAELEGLDRRIAETLHAIVLKNTNLDPKTWYGMPAYSRNGKVAVFLKPAGKFKSRYATLGFEEDAAIDDGDMFATSYAILDLNAEIEKRITELVIKASG